MTPSFSYAPRIGTHRRALHVIRFRATPDHHQPRAADRRTSGTFAAGPSARRRLPVNGDFDGDGRADLTVVRVTAGQREWWTRRSSDGQIRVTAWGSSATDGVFFFAPIDVDGDGKQDIMVSRTVSGQRMFIVLRSSDGVPLFLTWGLSTDTPLFGDYDGEARLIFAPGATARPAGVVHIPELERAVRVALWFTGDSFTCLSTHVRSSASSICPRSRPSTFLGLDGPPGGAQAGFASHTDTPGRGVQRGIVHGTGAAPSRREFGTTGWHLGRLSAYWRWAEN